MRRIKDSRKNPNKDWQLRQRSKKNNFSKRKGKPKNRQSSKKGNQNN